MTAPTGQQDFIRVLESLARGERPNDAKLDGFSDLDQGRARELAATWPSIPELIRLDMLARARARATESVGLDFRALAIIGLHDPLPAARKLAAASLGEAEDRATGRSLLDALRHEEHDSVRVTLAGALGPFVLQCEFGALHGDLGDEIVELLRSIASNPAEPVHTRAAAIRSLAPRSLDWVPGLIREAYYDDDGELRLAAVNAMGGTADEAWLEYLYEQLQSDDPEFRLAAARACGEIGDEEAVDAVAVALDDEEVSVAAAAVGALSEIGGELAMEYLEDFRRRVPEELTGTLEDTIVAMRAAEEGLADAEDDL